MKRILFALAGLVLCGSVFAAGGKVECDYIQVDEGTAPTGAAGRSLIYALSSDHMLKAKIAGNTAQGIALTGTANVFTETQYLTTLNGVANGHLTLASGTTSSTVQATYVYITTPNASASEGASNNGGDIALTTGNAAAGTGDTNGGDVTMTFGSGVNAGTYGRMKLTQTGGATGSGKILADGSLLTSLTAGNVTGDHTLPDGVLSANVPFNNAFNYWVAGQDISAANDAQVPLTLNAFSATQSANLFEAKNGAVTAFSVGPAGATTINGALTVSNTAGTGAGIIQSVQAQALTVKTTVPTGTAAGANLSLTAAAANTTGTGGSVLITAGSGAGTGVQNGGGVTLQTGALADGGANGGITANGTITASNTAGTGAGTITTVAGQNLLIPAATTGNLTITRTTVNNGILTLSNTAGTGAGSINTVAGQALNIDATEAASGGGAAINITAGAAGGTAQIGGALNLSGGVGTTTGLGGAILLKTQATGNDALTTRVTIAADGTITANVPSLTVSDAAGTGPGLLTSVQGQALTVAPLVPTAPINGAMAGGAATVAAANATASAAGDPGAAAGGQLNLTAGNAAQRTSGDAAGGSIVMQTGAPVGTSAYGSVTVNAASLILSDGAGTGDGTLAAIANKRLLLKGQTGTYATNGWGIGIQDPTTPTRVLSIGWLSDINGGNGGFAIVARNEGFTTEPLRLWNSGVNTCSLITGQAAGISDGTTGDGKYGGSLEVGDAAVIHGDCTNVQPMAVQSYAEHDGNIGFVQKQFSATHSGDFAQLRSSVGTIASIVGKIDKDFRYWGPVTGDVTGNVSGSSGSCTGNAETATEATNVTGANEATDTSCYPAFVTGTDGTLGIKTNAGLTFNSNTGLLTATGFSGALTGDVTGNVGQAADTTVTLTAGTVSAGTTGRDASVIASAAKAASAANGGNVVLTPGAKDGAGYDGMVTSTKAASFGGLRVGTVEYFAQDAAPTTRKDGSAIVADDRWYESDTNTEWFWNGTYWLSLQEFTKETTGVWNGSSYGMSAGTFPYSTTTDAYLTRFGGTSHVSTTNDGSNNYIAWFQTGASPTGRCSFTTAADAADTWVSHDAAVAVFLDLSAVGSAVCQWSFGVNAGTPGNCFISATLTYRLAHR